MLLLKDPSSIQKISLSWWTTINSGQDYIVNSDWRIEGAHNPSGDSIFNQIFNGQLEAKENGIDLYALVDFDPTIQVQTEISGFDFTGEGIPTNQQEPLKIFSGSHNSGETFVWLRDGQLGHGYLITNTVDISNGEVLEKSYYVKVHNNY